MSRAFVRGVTLKAVKSVQVQFCPFEQRVRSARQFLSYIGNENMRSSNEKCRIETKIMNNKSEPIVNITFEDGNQLLFKSRNLTTTEILKRFVAELKTNYPEVYQEAL
ncbi:large ribosomal subunit protein mL53-like [Glandiceps talaboti]